MTRFTLNQIFEMYSRSELGDSTVLNMTGIETILKFQKLYYQAGFGLPEEADTPERYERIKKATEMLLLGKEKG